MRIKIGNKIYDGSEEPIMIIFDRDGDKENLKLSLDNPKWQGKFARTPIGYFETEQDKINWMDDIEPELEEGKPILNLIGVEI